MDVLRIATRNSRLALWQSEFVATAIRALAPELEVELVAMTTTGDQILDQPLAKIGGKGLFIKELEVALQQRRADIAVHSSKDLPAQLPDGLMLAAFLPREDARDVLVSMSGMTLDSLPRGARVGTSSLRRQSQLRALRPDLELADLRGNVPTRLGKLERGDYQAIVLAAAGLKRLGLFDERAQCLDFEQMLPAVGQGAIAVECRRADESVMSLVSRLDCVPTRAALSAERAMNATLGGSCQVPIGGHAVIDDQHIRLTGLVASVDGQQLVRRAGTGQLDAAAALGHSLGQTLLTDGGSDILRALGL